MADLLTPEERAADLPALGQAGWQPVTGRDANRKIRTFASFSAAWGFMSRTALVAEKINHHLEWTNVYNVVDVVLTTHDCGGLSTLDLTLARRMDRLAGSATVQVDPGAPMICLCEIHPRR